MQRLAGRRERATVFAEPGIGAQSDTAKRFRFPFWVLLAATLFGFSNSAFAQCIDEDGDGCLECPPTFDPRADGRDTDGDGLCDAGEREAGTSFVDQDSDEDGIPDGREQEWFADTDGDGLCNAADPDSDNDGLFDGLEVGLTALITTQTDPSAGFFQEDLDPSTTTDPLDADSDGGGQRDGFEDQNRNGRVDADETDPLNRDDDILGDLDEDGILDRHEGAGDTDRDGIPDFLDLDSDGDGIGDSYEAGDLDPETPPVDSDGDGLPDAFDTDSDNDTVPDDIEGTADNDGDGFEDFRDVDSDDDSILDRDEVRDGVPVDTDEDRVEDFRDPDSDNDGISDRDEAFDIDPETPPPDTDGDGIPDYLDLDSDSDLIFDADEAGDDSLLTPPVDTDGDENPDYLDEDSDNDGARDEEEAGDDFLNTPPVDTDRDGIRDAIDPDSDNDGASDTMELNRPDPLGPLGDLDQDGVPDLRDPDSDGDGAADLFDNCPRVRNRDQANLSGSGPGDACSDDIDGDGIPNDRDNCVRVSNNDQNDFDADGIGDACAFILGEDGFPVDVDTAGGGCSTTSLPSHLPSAFWLLLGLCFLGGRRKSALCVLLFLSLPGFASAQLVEVSDFGIERYQPATDREGIIGVEWPEVPAHLAMQVTLLASYADAPLTARTRDGRILHDFVSRRVSASVLGTLPLFDRVSLAMEIPVTIAQSRDDFVPDLEANLPELATRGLGDLRIVPKAQLLSIEEHGIALALIGEFTLPLGGAGSYLREQSPTFAPQIALGRALGPIRVAANLGYRMRSSSRSLGVLIDDEVIGRLGLALELTEYRLPLEVDLSFDFAISSQEPLEDRGTTSAEMRLGLLYDFGSVAPFVQGSASVLRGYGTPLWRLVAGARIGRFDVADPSPCPGETEDYDGFEDEDGCEDPDDDHDGLLDVEDECPRQAEDFDQVGDDDGCPEDDEDHDGIRDALDPCPEEAGPGGCGVEPGMNVWRRGRGRRSTRSAQPAAAPAILPPSNRPAVAPAAPSTDSEASAPETGDSETGDSGTGNSETGNSETGNSETGSSETADSEAADSTADSETGPDIRSGQVSSEGSPAPAS